MKKFVIFYHFLLILNFNFFLKTITVSTSPVISIIITPNASSFHYFRPRIRNKLTCRLRRPAHFPLYLLPVMKHSTPTGCPLFPENQSEISNLFFYNLPLPATPYTCWYPLLSLHIGPESSYNDTALGCRFSSQRFLPTVISPLPIWILQISCQLPLLVSAYFKTSVISNYRATIFILRPLEEVGKGGLGRCSNEPDCQLHQVDIVDI